MPNPVKLALLGALLLSACGTTATQVTDVGAPATTSPSTAVGRASGDQDDVDSIHKLGQFVEAADDADWTDVRDLTIPGLTVLAPDEPSVGPGTISLAVLGDRDFGMAILSPSGTCLWYAYLDGQDRFGTGEPCTAVAAISGSTAKLSTDSPWHLVLDDMAAAGRAKAAQSALRNALVAAKTFYSDAATYNGLSPVKLREIEPSLNFVVAGEPSTDAGTVSVAVAGDQVGAAALSANGTCYWIAERVGSLTQYGEGSPCTGTAALAAHGSAWI